MKIKLAAFLFIGISLSSTGMYAQQAHSNDQNANEGTIRTLISLIDYIGKDYINAIDNGVVINESEYTEMMDFSRQVADIHRKLSPEIEKPEFAKLKPSIARLTQAVKNKADDAKISALTDSIRQELLAMNLITVIPSQWPDIKHGADIFTTYCQSCHGQNGEGDGPLAASLNPPPTNFHDATLASKLSPLQAYNSLRLGIEGTSMRAFHEISDQEAWDVAFYINSLPYNTPVSSSEKEAVLSALEDTVSLKALTTHPNKEWISFFEEEGLDVADGMSVMRALDGSVFSENKQPLQKAITLLDQAYKAYEAGEKDKANTLALSAYLDGVEPMEPRIKANNPPLVYQIENQMLAVRASIKKGASLTELQENIEASVVSIKEAQAYLIHDEDSFWFSFIMAGSILLREGLEAFLIILVILGVLKSVGAAKSVKYVHAGWLLALFIGIISWFFTESLLSMSSVQRELMEGIGALIAVVLLLYIGFWLHDKTHISHWKEFVEVKIQRLVEQNNHWGLAFLAFVVVFREAFESVIFLSSISIQAGPAGDTGILLGSGSAIIAVILLGYIMVKFTTKVPIRSLFKYSSAIMALLAVVLVGQAIHEFQEAGYFGISSLPFHLNLPTIGLYPTLQTTVAQLIIIGSIIGLWVYSNRRAAMKKVAS
jgi:high-affinity iron transporter